MKKLSLVGLLIVASHLFATDTTEAKAKPRVVYGTASFYANSFHGKKLPAEKFFLNKNLQPHVMCSHLVHG